MVTDITGETHELIQPPSVDDAVAVGAGVDTMIAARRMTIDQDLEPHWLAIRTRPENQMQVPRMETIRDPSVRLREEGVLAADPPIALERPLIERQR
jgi:hypothetical protein